MGMAGSLSERDGLSEVRDRSPGRRSARVSTGPLYDTRAVSVELGGTDAVGEVREVGDGDDRFEVGTPHVGEYETAAA